MSGTAPILRRPAPAPYFHPFFKFSDSLPLGEVIKIYSAPIKNGGWGVAWGGGSELCYLSALLEMDIRSRNVSQNVSTSEAYLEPSRTSMMQLFYENSCWLKGIKYFCKKDSSKMFKWIPNTFLWRSKIAQFYRKESFP